MVAEDVDNKVLEYLKKRGQTNTFRLARELGIDRYRILNIVKKLEEKGAVEFRSGIVKFPVKEKKVVKKLKVKKAPLKVIRKTIIKKVYVKSKKLKEQAEHIEELEETIKELQKKVSAQPKIKTIIKKVPVELKKEPIKEWEEEIQPETQPGEEVSEKPEGAEITEEVPEETVELKKEPIKEGKEEIKPKKFKLPKFDISLKNIQQLKILEFIKLKTKIGKPKINFSELNKNIQQLHIPEILR